MQACRRTIAPTAFSAGFNLSWWLALAMFTILFVGDLLSGLNFVPQIAPDLALLSVQFLLLGFAFTRIGSPLRFPGIGLVVMLLSVSLLSAIANGQGAIELAVFVRAMIGQYVVLLAMMNLRFSEDEFKRLNRVIFALCALQIPVGFYRMLTSGNDVFLAGGGRSFGTEAATGTMARAGGSLGTTFPLIVIGFLFAFYLWQQKRIYVFWMLGFVFFSFCTGKRAFPLILPVFLTALYFLLGRGNAVLSRKLINLAIVAAVGLLGGLFLHPSLNPSGTIGGQIDLRYAWEQATANQTQVTWEGKQAGRLSTSAHVVETAWGDGLLRFLVGRGPATMIKSGLVDSTYDLMSEELEVVYGITGGAWVFVQIGLAGVVCYLLVFGVFFHQTMKIRKRLSDPYWRAICGGLIGFHVVIFFDTLGYSTTCVSGKLLPALYWWFLAQVLLSARRPVGIVARRKNRSSLGSAHV